MRFAERLPVEIEPGVPRHRAVLLPDPEVDADRKAPPAQQVEEHERLRKAEVPAVAAPQHALREPHGALHLGHRYRRRARGALEGAEQPRQRTAPLEHLERDEQPADVSEPPEVGETKLLRRHGLLSGLVLRIQCSVASYLSTL